MTEKEARRLVAQAGQGQTIAHSVSNGGQGHDGITSEGEEALFHYLHIIAPQLPKPVRQFKPIAGRQWSLDFAWPAKKIAVEVEGRGHRLSPRYEQDIEKYNTLSAEGWTILRITKELLLSNPTGFIEVIIAACS